MEKWQKNHLIKNFKKLVEETICDELIFSHLISQRVLANVDVERIRKTDRYEQASALYATLVTRTNGYVEMAVALAEGNQTGPFKVFLEGFAEHVIPVIKVAFLGNTLHLNDVFDGQEMQRILNEMKHHLTLEKCVGLYDKSKKSEEPIKLIRDTIPDKISFYVPRSLSKRVNVNPEVYKLKCSDVFVFKGIGWSELKQMLDNERVEKSSTQLLSLSTRFIILDQIEDWEEIRITARVPVHLIKYERDNRERHILEATTGGSTVIHQFLKHQQTTEGLSESVSISEDVFFEEVSREGASGVCICDLPGMGKSLLLANLARKMKLKHPDRVVVFIQLSQFLPFVVAKTVKQVKFVHDENLAKKMLLDFLTQSSLEYFLLTELLDKFVTQLELFFDGFDEIHLGHVEVAKQVLTSASRLPNTRIFVTSRPNMRHELEASLHVISYDILEFNHANQIDFLAAFWISLKPTCKTEKLREFAEFCVKKLKKSLNEKEESITGIPLQCRLVAEVFSRNALIFAHPKRNASAQELCKIESSLADLYTKYFDLRFSKLSTPFNRSVSTKHVLSSAAWQVTRLVEAVVGGKACASEIQEVKKFHMLQALKLLFPEKSEMFSKLFLGDTTTPQLSSVLSVGIMQRHFSEVRQESFQFLHRTFAEYLAAEPFANLLSNKKVEKKLRNELLQFLFREVMRAGQNGYYLAPYFVHGVVVHFLNTACEDKMICPNDYVLLDAFFASFNNHLLFRFMTAIIRHNFLNLLILLRKLLSKKSLFSFHFLKIFTFRPSTRRFFVFLSTAARYAGRPLIEQLFQLLHECFHIDLKGRHKVLLAGIMSQEGCKNALQIARESGNYEVVEFFTEGIPVETENIISILGSRLALHPAMIQERILNILLGRTKNPAKSLILAKTQFVHLDVIKLLLRKGVDPRAAYSMETLVHRTPREMYGNDFADLCRFLIKDFGAIDLFEEVEEKWKSPLPEILANERISEHIIKKIYDLPWLDEIGSEGVVEAETWPSHRKVCVDINYSNDRGKTLLMCAVSGNRSMGVIRRLIEEGTDVWAKDKLDGYNFVHYFSCAIYSPEEYDELAQMLVNMQMGKLFQATDIYGNTPLHKYFEFLYTKTLNLLMGQHCFVDVNAVNNKGESFLYKAVEGDRGLALVKNLVELGADWSIKSKEGHNLAHVSAYKGLVDHLKYFVELGCDINEVDQEGNNTLQHAVSNHANTKVEVIQFLTENGARKDNKNKKGKTAYMIAEKAWKAEKILELLK